MPKQVVIVISNIHTACSDVSLCRAAEILIGAAPRSPLEYATCAVALRE